MIVSHKHKFIFMKTRKTGGTSIQSALAPICGEDDIITPDVDDMASGKNVDKFFTDHPHPLLIDVKNYLSGVDPRNSDRKDVWSKYFKFSIVRNPWEIVVSRYNWNKRNEEGSIEDFREWLKTYCSEEAVWGPAHYCVNDIQVGYTHMGVLHRIRSTYGEIGLDYIARFENIKEDFKYICDKIGIDRIELPHKKKGFKPTWHKHYTEYYDDKSVELVNEYFSADLDIFNYKFNPELKVQRIKEIINKKTFQTNFSLGGDFSLGTKIDKDGDNINGPSLIKVPSWVKNPIAKYYLYFGHHQGIYIRMAYSDNIEGPWTLYSKGTLQLSDTSCGNHIASPDVHIDEENKRIVMYYHGDTKDGQKTFVSFSDDGLNFNSIDKPKGKFYFRVFRYNNKFYSIAKNDNENAVVYKSDTWDGEFEPIFNLINKIRHSAVYVKNDVLYLFYTLVGEVREKIYLTKIKLQDDHSKWEPISVQMIMKPERDYEGNNLTKVPSNFGSVYEKVNQLRDPCVYEEDDKLYLLYSTAGESGIGLSRLW